MNEATLRKLDDDDIPELMRWIPDAEAADRWSGPFLRFPFTSETFREDLRLDKVDSWALVNRAGDLVGFGQVHERYGRNHLGRLAVHPDRRGSGLGHLLVAELMQRGAEHPGHAEFGLYVYPDNAAALRCYRAAGFVAAEDPGRGGETRGLDYCYMIASPQG